MYTCEKCDKKCETLKKLAVHKKSNCKKKYQCYICGEYFRFEKVMLEHLLRFHDHNVDHTYV